MALERVPAAIRADGGVAADAARILGRVSDAELRALYEAALCLIFPSRYEGFGLPIAEETLAQLGWPMIALGWTVLSLLLITGGRKP